ncbi:PEP/pyruvate-binding domain-containing protein [Sinomonas sp. ASV322]|uniref:PEP/pyruvate-binding domain-containing protein n=1 Tax=Sinomonas sp. ASV322 TaxID=3041920 RepID=UPI0027DE3EE5|nr:PEP/pyruvate-binding domain-containing protein [Sinomonas sp. ASV322]MDQ4504248.1 PEP/pyruvate-binding domain-containing protein [Sinomonas sp. ASV322]
MDDGAPSPFPAESPGLNPAPILPLASLRATDLPVAGGKGANLGELIAAGLPVPPGFVVTTEAYRAHAVAAGLDPAAAAEEPAAARATLEAAPLAPALTHEIRAALAELGPVGTRVAVRSSATAEDLPGAAFAGQQDTFLDVEGPDALADAVRRCWASLWTDRAVQYRERQGISPADVAIAVVVQRMAEADAAGVLFTANPLTGRRAELVVDAAPGLGEAVVSGQVTPEHLVLDREGAVGEWTPAHDGGARVLPDRAARELAELAVRAEKHFGVPQDIEWALADGRIVLLQARPMTALPLEPPVLNRFQQMMTPFFLEMFVSRPYPIDVTAWLRPGVERMLGIMMGSVGVRFPPLGQLVRERDGVALQLVPAQPRPSPLVLGAPLAILRRARRYPVRDWTTDPQFAEFEAIVDALDAQDPATLGWADLLARVDRCTDAMEPLARIRAAYLPGAFLPFAPLRLGLALLGLTRLAPPLVAGARTRTRAGNDALDALADAVRADPELSLAARELDAPAFLDAVRSRPEFEEFDHRLDAYLAEYGHRESLSIVLATAPTWRDDPTPVAAIIQAAASEPPRERGPNPGDAAMRELLAHPFLRSPRAARMARAVVDAARRGLAFREDTHFFITRVLPPLRATFLELGRRLTAVGALPAAEDVFHLRLEELREVRPPEAIDDVDRARVRALAARRAALRREYAGVPMLDLATVLPGRAGADDGGSALIRGTPASGGVAEGPVRIVRGPDEFGALRAGDVLVCPNTNPSWTPLFARAAAVVVDTGGLGSHAAIVAREYGVPAVMGTRRGTSVLREGQRVRVDGSRGRVDAA